MKNETNDSAKLMFFPSCTEEIESYIETLLSNTLKENYETEKLILFSLVNVIFSTNMPADERCPNTILFLLQSTSEGEEDSGLTLVDKLFLACEQNGMHDNFCDIYWYIKDTDEFVPAVIRLISVFQFYGILFPNPVISNDGKTFLYYPKTKTSSIYEIPSSVTKINAHSFAGNPYIKTVKIPANVTYIGRASFVECRNLSKFIVDERNKTFFSENGVLYSGRKTIHLVKYPAGIKDTDITISRNVKVIDSLAFEHCINLKTVSFESHATKLESSAFFDCPQVESITIMDGKELTAPPDAFDGLEFEDNSPINTDGTPDEANQSVIETRQKGNTFDQLTPSQIKKMFDDYIVGHEDAKKTLSVAVYSHILRCNSGSKELGKSNILICGPTGCGKTEFARTIAKCLKVPFVTVDATSITETGMKGNDPSDMLKDLLIAANNNLKLAQNGIIYIDEIDKLAVYGDNSYRESYSKGTQQGLLRIVEGGIIPLRMDNPLNPITINFDTSNVLFIAGGAFGSLTSDKKSDKEKVSIGFGNFNEKTSSLKPQTAKKLETSDFVKYGMVEEFMGRFPVIVQLHQLSEDEIYRIMVEPKNSVVSQYQKLVQCIGSELDFDDELLHKIAKNAMKTGTGARGLRTVIENLVESIIYELPDKKNVKKVIVHSGMFDNKQSPEYVV